MTIEGRPFAIDVSLVECVVVVVPHVESLGGIAGALAELVGDRTIRVLDLVLVVKNSTSGEIAALGPETSDAASFRGLVDERIGNLLSENGSSDRRPNTIHVSNERSNRCRGQRRKDPSGQPCRHPPRLGWHRKACRFHRFKASSSTGADTHTGGGHSSWSYSSQRMADP